MNRAHLVLATALLLVTSGCVGIGGSDGEWRFEDAAATAGLEYTARASGIGSGNSGVYVTDFNNDGWPDVLAIGGEKPVLFKNTGGEFQRVDSFPDVDISIQGALFFDADNDGREELLLLPRDGTAVFLENTGESYVATDSDLEVPLDVAVGASAADYDRDGDQDVFIIQNGDWGDGTPEGYLQQSGYVTDDNGNPNYLFENTDEGFRRATDSGIEGERWSLATSFVDLTGDGYPDIHVANDFNNDTLYVNRGNGSFEQVVLGPKTARNGMSSEVGDFNGDHHPDIFVTNIYFPISKTNFTDEQRDRIQRYFKFVLRSKRIEGNNLLINQGNGEFSFESETYSVRKGGWGWAAIYTDLNNDIERDLFHATQDIEVLRMYEDDQYFYPMLWTGGEKGFNDQNSSKRGLREMDGRGVASLDFDRDGDIDIIVAAYNGEFALYENNADTVGGRHSIQLRVVKANGETTAIGARVSVSAGGTTQFAIQNANADYLSQDTRVLHFGLGNNDHIDRIKVIWPDGTTRTFENIDANQRLVLTPNGTLQTYHYQNTGTND